MFIKEFDIPRTTFKGMSNFWSENQEYLRCLYRNVVGRGCKFDAMSKNINSRYLMDLLTSYGLVDILGNIHSRLTHDSHTSLDHVITNCKYFNAHVIEGFRSDHYGQWIDVYDDVGQNIVNIRRFSSSSSNQNKKKMFRRQFSERNFH